MPSLKELMTPQHLGILIYCGIVPPPDGILEQVEEAEKAFERLGLGGATPMRTVTPTPFIEKVTRVRASITRDIVAFLSTVPLTMRTPRQVWSAIKSANPKQTTDTVQTRLKNNAGKPDLWISGPGNKYGMPGAVAAVGIKNKTATSVAANDLSVPPAPAAVAGEKAQTRILNYVIAHGGYLQAHLISAFAASPTPIKAQYVGVELSRLVKAKKITDSNAKGPYWSLAAAKPTAAAGGIGDGAAAPA
jgi:hypothetical protein